MNQDDRKQPEQQQYRDDLEAMAELLLDIYLDKKHPPPEDADNFLTRPARGRKIRLPPSAQLRRAERSPTNDSSTT
jgi:hypothetical protein